jgi:thiamine biosynthesis lipoprotein
MGFGPKPIKKFPDSIEVKAILECVGMNFISLKGNELKKDKSCVQLI